MKSIETSVYSLHPRPSSVSHSIISRSITVIHDASLSATTIAKSLDESGFDVYDIFTDPHDEIHSNGVSLEDRLGTNWTQRFNEAVARWKWKHEDLGNAPPEKRRRHIEECEQCRLEANEKEKPSATSSGSSKDQLTLYEEGLRGDNLIPDASSDGTSKNPILSSVAVSTPSDGGLFQASFTLGGMTCASCVGNIEHALTQNSWVHAAEVALLTNSASITFQGREHVKEIIEAIEDAGYEATLVGVKEAKPQKKSTPKAETEKWRASYAITGMTCSSCVGTITKGLQTVDWITNVDVNLISNSATVVFTGKDNLPRIQEIIEDLGYEATLSEVEEINLKAIERVQRKVAILVDGIYCDHCPLRIKNALKRDFGEQITIERDLTISDPILEVVYLPHVPDFTIRRIFQTISGVDEAFKPSVYHPLSLEERSRRMRIQERRHVLFRLGLSVVAAIPTFIIGIVLMSLVHTSNPSRQYIMQPMWAGHVTRAEWALFIIATPVYLFAADAFHRPALKQLRGLWRPGSKTPIFQRFYRFGSMNTLISLGTTIAYIASIVALALTATKSSQMSATSGLSTYFDSVVFLTMFLLIGRFLEAYSKAKTGDAVSLLGNLRPTEAILVHRGEDADSEDEKKSAEEYSERINVDLLEVGDSVNVLHGDSPPSDGIVERGVSKFDESSLTGESRLVPKSEGDEVFSGTVNKGGPLTIRVSKVMGSSMLDQIVKVVREGQARRAPIERMADLVTGYFVPVVVFIAVATWIIWMSLGLSGSLPHDYLNVSVGGWPFWSLQFAIAAFVVACPCGLGLAAPTALFVGGGLAARHGILVKGGGEAFEEASHLDCVVFDKTGTLTEGGEPAITDSLFKSEDKEQAILEMAMSLEEQSGHPLARAMALFCTSKEVLHGRKVSDVEEIPGKGLKGTFASSNEHSEDQQAIIGNEVLLADHGVSISGSDHTILEEWKAQGKSVVLLASRRCVNNSESNKNQATVPSWKLAAMFAVSDPLRPDAASTIGAIQRCNVAVWMVSGDNPTTARAVGAQVGIPAENIIAGVLPEQKAEKVKYLQQTLSKRPRSGWKKIKGGAEGRATVAFVGDGINDSPALTQADVGIAIGSGSDVAISSAEFVLVSSHLSSILTLIDLSRAVFRRVKFNFAWALVYNLIGLPVAAGVLYPVRSGGGHVKLDPVWASLAMALSSVSVVASSLLLKSRLPLVGVRLGKPVSGEE